MSTKIRFKPLVTLPNIIVEILKEQGFQLEVENGYKCYTWVLSKEKPFSDTLPEYVTYVPLASGSANTVHDAMLFASEWLQEQREHELLAQESLGKENDYGRNY